MNLLHFADLHLGVENYGRIDPKRGLHTRTLDVLRSLEYAFEMAIEEETDLVIFAGDAYKTCNPSPTHQREFAQKLSLLRKADIPIVLVPGNHDIPAAFGKANSIDIFSAVDLENTHIIRNAKVEIINTRSGQIQVAGLPWPNRNILRARDDFRDETQETIKATIEKYCHEIISEKFVPQLNPEIPSILVAHVDTAGAFFSGKTTTSMVGEDPKILLSSLANKAFDYVALGHIHKHQDLNKNGRPPVVYSGSMQYIDFGEELDKKGFCIVEISESEQEENNRNTTFEFVPLDEALHFVTIDVFLSTEDGDLTTQILRAIAKSEIEGAIVRLLYTKPEGSTDKVDLERVRAALERAEYVAYIRPHPTKTEITRKDAISSDLSLKEALEKYIDSNDGLGGHKNELLRLASELEKELADEKNSETS